MGTFYEKITLGNGGDVVLAKRGYIPKEKIRAVEVEAMPDTGAWMLVINEEVQQQLGLATVDHAKTTMADGTTAINDITEPVEIRWKDRRTSQEAVVIPGAKEVLLGALPLEGRAAAGRHGFIRRSRKPKTGRRTRRQNRIYSLRRN